MSTKTMSVQPMAGCIGGLVTGVHLGGPLMTEELAGIKEALLKYKVLFFHQQDLSPQAHKAFASNYGPLEEHLVLPSLSDFPEIVVLDTDSHKPPVEEWHADVTYDNCPPMGSVLHCTIAPSFGGDTLWANMEAAYEDLSDGMQSLLSSMSAVHHVTQGYRHTLQHPETTNEQKKMLYDQPPAVHPVVRTHPETKRQGLFVNQLFTTHLSGVSERESRALLGFLFEHMSRPEFTCRFRWQQNSVAFWDNRCTQHCPINDFFPKRRRMQRVVIKGDKPY